MHFSYTTEVLANDHAYAVAKCGFLLPSLYRIIETLFATPFKNFFPVLDFPHGMAQ
jgi:hypothetical protein